MPDPSVVLRLHLSENNAGCSPRVLRALARLRPDQVASYPTYEAAAARSAAHYGVAPAQVALTNGLDEGILAVAAVQLRDRVAGDPAAAILPEPAFDVYRSAAAVAGGAVVSVGPASDLAFPRRAVLEAITARTRVVFVSSPNNPTGLLTPPEVIAEIAQALPPRALLFLDEAYAEFSASSFLSSLAAFPNIVIGRSMSKAFGLAGLRVGCLIASPEVIDVLRAWLPIYNVNAAALAALDAALDDPDHVAAYIREVAVSRRLIFEACDRLGVHCWRSAANFVLVRVGAAAEFVTFAAARGVRIRDRSGVPGCAGCVRVTAGLASDTRRFVEILEAFVVPSMLRAAATAGMGHLEQEQT